VRLALFLPFPLRETGMDRVERSLLIQEAAELLGLSRRTVYYRIREGKLRTIRTRCGSQRVLVSSIETLLCEMRGVPPPSAAAISPAAVV
jgi:excisionase family DNA binding protein